MAKAPKQPAAPVALALDQLQLIWVTHGSYAPGYLLVTPDQASTALAGRWAQEERFPLNVSDEQLTTYQADLNANPIDYAALSAWQDELVALPESNPTPPEPEVDPEPPPVDPPPVLPEYPDRELPPVPPAA